METDANSNPISLEANESRLEPTVCLNTSSFARMSRDPEILLPVNIAVVRARITPRPRIGKPSFHRRV